VAAGNARRTGEHAVWISESGYLPGYDCGSDIEIDLPAPAGAFPDKAAGFLKARRR
jgi:hypothetical protein